MKFTDVAVEDLFEDLIRFGRGEPVSQRPRIHWTISQLYELCENSVSGELVQRGYRPEQLSSTALHEQLIAWIRGSMDDALRRRGMMLEQLYAMKKIATLMPVSAFVEADLHDAVYLAAHALGLEEIPGNLRTAEPRPAGEPPAPAEDQPVATVAVLPTPAAPATTTAPRRPDAGRRRTRRERKNKPRK